MGINRVSGKRRREIGAPIPLERLGTGDRVLCDSSGMTGVITERNNQERFTSVKWDVAGKKVQTTIKYRWDDPHIPIVKFIGA